MKEKEKKKSDFSLMRVYIWELNEKEKKKEKKKQEKKIG